MYYVYAMYIWGCWVPVLMIVISMVSEINNNNYELYFWTDQRGEHNGTPLHKTMFYRQWIQFSKLGHHRDMAPEASIG